MFEYQVTPEGHDWPVTLKFKDFGDVPGRVSRYYIGDIERQVWASLEWGLVEPAHWPLDSQSPGHTIFDEVPQKQLTDCFTAWQKATEE